ncbi:MAG: DUF1566 domain-containing protein [Desulfobacteraceae bacterium]|nr:DUF1566 domain-containing protein [Pseudomonadota bacterium]MBU4463760.1 DUF1566 domain-containing protein [Pseudomonadota bacterium]MCG2754643.1 DUF1566 domain-containing protein [Desulfobacteraceae bacterium]
MNSPNIKEQKPTSLKELEIATTCSRTILFLLLAFLLFSGEKSFGEEGRFLDHINGTVTDRLTGLMWTRNAGPAAGTCNWFCALDAVSQLNTKKHCGYHDWRLPNVNELATLIDRSRHAPALPRNHPFSNVKVWYWTSTTTADYSNHAEYVWGVRESDCRRNCSLNF